MGTCHTGERAKVLKDAGECLVLRLACEEYGGRRSSVIATTRNGPPPHQELVSEASTRDCLSRGVHDLVILGSEHPQFDVSKDW